MGVYIGDEAKGDMLGELLTFRRRNVVSEPEPGWNRRSSGGCSSLDCGDQAVGSLFGAARGFVSQSSSSPEHAATAAQRKGSLDRDGRLMGPPWRRAAPDDDLTRDSQRRRSSPPQRVVVS